VQEYPVVPKAWKFITFTPQPGESLPLKEWIVVAISDQTEALKALRDQRDANVEIIPRGEAGSDILEWFDIKDGEIFCVMAVQQ
jgi:hypothetical protein